MTDEQQPILVGVAAVQQRAPAGEGHSAIGLMEQALRQAAADAGAAPELLTDIKEILVPKGIWEYSDPARLLADRVAATGAKTLLAEIGVLQQTLMSHACNAIAAGDADLVAVVGGEARNRFVQAQRAGVELEDTVQEDVAPDTMLTPQQELWSEVESATGLGMADGYFAIVDSALRARQGLTVDEHRDQIAAMYERFSNIAADNPDAWYRDPVDAATIRDPSPGNRMLAFPYTKLLNSRWSVDQAGALLFCSVAKARALGIPESLWVYPQGATESNHMTMLSSRKELNRSIGFEVAGERLAALTDTDLSQLRTRELYSCFPGALRMQLDAFGMDGSGDLTLIGAMTFAGGPLNNFVLQGMVNMARLLREKPQEQGLITSVSGMFTKQGCALFSGTAPAAGWQFEDVSATVAERLEVLPLVADYTGDGVVAGYTVLHGNGAPWRAVAVFDIPGERRTVAYSESPSLMATMMAEEQVGRPFYLQGGMFSAG